MPPPANKTRARLPERDFYLREFRGRTLAIACPAPNHGARRLRSVVDTLGRNGTRVLLLSTEAEPLAKLARSPALELAASDDGLAAKVWRRLRREGRAGLHCGPEREFTTACVALAASLGVFKLVWLDPEGGLHRRGKRLSFVHRDELRTLPKGRGRRADLLRAIDTLLARGVESVNLCTVEGLREELFTYEGSGTLFTRDRYVEVRALVLDDFDAASALVARGVREGALARRTRSELDRALSGGYGAFIEGRDLAGVASLLRYPRDPELGRAGEIACLYTLTRFLGEGVGVELIERLLRDAKRAGLDFVFACTAVDAAARFFSRRGFRRVAGTQVPPDKWVGYDTRRRARVRVYRHPL